MMTAHDKLASIGRALYGPDWMAPTSRALKISYRMMQRYAAGTHQVPYWIWPALKAVTQCLLDAAPGEAAARREALTGAMEALSGVPLPKHLRTAFRARPFRT